LPSDHHVPWDEIHITFRGYHHYVSLMRRKLTEFLDLRQGNHSVYEYCQELNNLAQHRACHIHTNAKKVKLFHKGITIQL
jgi:hypothetical protein